jgi:hypothetical protein
MKNSFRTAVAAVGLMVGSLGVASPALASTVVVGQCDQVTDGDADGCLFSGNINENPDPTNVNSYKNAEAAYNAFLDPDILLNWITATDAPDFASFGTFTGAGGTSGTFNLPGWDIDYFAVKAGDQFWLYEYDGTNTWSIPGQNAISHIAFFGDPGGVPEPSTWAMMLLGFGAAGFALRRRRQTAKELLQVA